MDKVDEQIVSILEQNARQTSNTVAKQMNVSPATVRRRLKRLLDTKELNLVALRDLAKAGFPIAALIGLNIEHETHEEVVAKILKLPGVCWVSTTTGRFDSFVFVRATSNEHLYGFLKDVLLNIKGIKDSETFICMYFERSGWKGIC